MAIWRGGRGLARPPHGDDEAGDARNMRLAFFPLTDLGNAERFRERYKRRLLWCPAIGWLAWDGRRWSRDGADDLVKIAEHDTVRAIQDEADAVRDSGDKDVTMPSAARAIMSSRSTATATRRCIPTRSPAGAARRKR
jgi:putative DNA primase/helicase